MNDSPIEIRELSYAFGRTRVLDRVSLRVARGSLCAIVGANGVGKSTLLRLVAGILAPPLGSITTLGLDPRRAGPRVRERLGYVADSLDTPRWMRVRDYLAFVAPFYGTWDRDEERRLTSTLALDPAARIASLSKGFKARVALVAALAHRPKLLLLDEPFAGFDASVRADVFDALLAPESSDGRTVVFVSHSTADVERLADHVVVLDRGRVAFDGAIEELKRRYARVVVRLRHADAAFEAPAGVLSERSGDTVVLRFRDFDERAEAALAHHPSVDRIELRPRALDDVVRACIETEHRENVSCAAS